MLKNVGDRAKKVRYIYCISKKMRIFARPHESGKRDKQFKINLKLKGQVKNANYSTVSKKRKSAVGVQE